MTALIRHSRALRASQTLACVTFAALVAHLAFGFGGESSRSLFQDWVYDGLFVYSAGLCLLRAVMVRADRLAWIAMGAGLLAWAGGEIHYSLLLSGLGNPPYPSTGDVLFLSFYPMSYVALILLLPARLRRAHVSVWLDGLAGALAVGALAAALVFRPVLAATGGTTWATVTDLVYPSADLALLVLVIAAATLSGLRAGRAWMLIGCGLTIAAVADAVFVARVASGAYQDGTALDALWPAATLLIGQAALQPAQPVTTTATGGWRLLAIPAGAALVALSLLTLDEFVAPVDDVSVALGLVTLVVATARAALTFRENLRLLEHSRRDALTDPLTGLGNRRRLLEDLELAAARADRGAACVLLLCDLDGFKRYNDTYGHPAGDTLLARLGRRLADAVTGGAVYRLGGDEFCVLVAEGVTALEPLQERIREALSEQADGFAVGTSIGAVRLPTEATSASAALLLADERLYTQKPGSDRSVVRQQASDVLIATIREREPELSDHGAGVRELAVAAGRRLGLRGAELEELGRAAALHDVGKVAIPETILHKPSSLDDGEWALMRQHTVIGERIIAASAAMASIGRVVRASHERWDGAGYPDGLAGEQIPLGARIVAVCDAYDAMRSARPYGRVLSQAEATAELRRCAGAQFDPRVVDAVCDALEEAPDFMLTTQRAAPSMARAARAAALPAVLAGLITLAALPTSARANTDHTRVQVSAGVLEVTPADGFNAIVVDRYGDQLVVWDAAAPETRGPGCSTGTVAYRSVVTCPAAQVTRVAARLGLGNDVADVRVDVPATIAGEDGADELAGGGARDTLTGGEGTDELRGRGGADALAGDGGADVLDGGAGGDVLAGGDALDTVDYRARTTTVAVTGDGVANDGEAGEGDDVRPDVEQVLLPAPSVTPSPTPAPGPDAPASGAPAVGGTTPPVDVTPAPAADPRLPDALATLGKMPAQRIVVPVGALRLPLEVKCAKSAPAPCRGRITVERRVTGTRAAASRRGRVIASRAYRVRRGRTIAVKARISRRGRGVLRAEAEAGRRRVPVTVRMSRRGGGQRVVRTSIVLRGTKRG